MSYTSAAYRINNTAAGAAMSLLFAEMDLSNTMSSTVAYIMLGVVVLFVSCWLINFLHPMNWLDVLHWLDIFRGSEKPDINKNLHQYKATLQVRLAKYCRGKVDWSKPADELRAELQPVVEQEIDATYPQLSQQDRATLINAVLENIKRTEG